MHQVDPERPLLKQTQVESETVNIIVSFTGTIGAFVETFHFLCCTAEKPMLPKVSAIING